MSCKLKLRSEHSINATAYTWSTAKIEAVSPDSPPPNPSSSPARTWKPQVSLDKQIHQIQIKDYPHLCFVGLAKNGYWSWSENHSAIRCKGHFLHMYVHVNSSQWIHVSTRVAKQRVGSAGSAVGINWIFFALPMFLYVPICFSVHPTGCHPGTEMAHSPLTCDR